MVTARTFVPGELLTAAKLNTIRDDILELDAVAGFNDTQYGTVTISSTTGTATISAVSDRAFVIMLGWTSNANEASYPGSTPRLTKTNATTLTGTKNGGGDTVVVSFCVVDPRG